MIKTMWQTQGLKIKCSDWQTHFNTIQAGVSNSTITIPDRSACLKSLFTVLTHSGGHSNAVSGLQSYKFNNSAYQYRIGSVLYPNQEVSVSATNLFLRGSQVKINDQGGTLTMGSSGTSYISLGALNTTFNIGGSTSPFNLNSAIIAGYSYPVSAPSQIGWTQKSIISSTTTDSTSRAFSANTTALPGTSSLLASFRRSEYLSAPWSQTATFQRAGESTQSSCSKQPIRQSAQDQRLIILRQATTWVQIPRAALKHLRSIPKPRTKR